MSEFNQGLLIGLLVGAASAGYIVYMASRQAIKQARERGLNEMLASIKDAHPRAVKRVLEKMRKP